MTTIASLRAVIKAALHVNSPHVDAAIAEAFKHIRGEEVWFNGGEWKFSTVAGKVKYALPDDFLGIRSGGAWIKSSTETGDARRPLAQMSVGDLEHFRFWDWDDYGDNWLANDTAGIPNAYGIDLSGKNFLIAPKPGTGGDEVFFRYTKDLGSPIYTAAVTSSTNPSLVTTVTLTDPDGATITTDFSNDWLKHGFNALRDRSLYILWTLYHHGTEQSTANAQAALMRYLEEINRLRGETNQIQSVKTFAAFI